MHKHLSWRQYGVQYTGVPAFSASGALILIIFMEKRTMKQQKFFSAFLLITMLAFFLGCASTSQKEGTGEYIDDTVITTKVKAAILKDPDLKAREINVETFKGVVQLSGFVNSQADINKAIKVARGIKGVTAVKNDMRIK
jgi:osmotically-inducible protein OsmY